MDQEIISNAAETVSANLILPIIKDLVLPKIQKLIPSNKQKQDFVLENIETYLTRKYEKYQTIDTLVFSNMQTIFDLLYLPLTLTCKSNNENLRITVDSFPQKLLPKFHRVIIEDTAGMGKSTISKKLFRSCIETNSGIPVLIELRRINYQNSILEDIQKQLSPLNKLIDIEDIYRLIQTGSFVFLFDGLDEISKKDKAYVLEDLHSFIEKSNDNYFLITSRFDDSLSSFGDFQKFSIEPLSKSDAFKLIEKYDYYSFNKIASSLIDKLEEVELEHYKEYLKNPFLVSLLYKSFDFKKEIPHKKTQFYSQVYSALFETHDLSKEGYLVRDKYSNLHHDDFDKVLRYIGFYTSTENKIEYEKDYILSVITNVVKKMPNLQFQSSDFLKDLVESVPLFRLEGNCYKWAHKSLQDYFCAKFIYIDLKQDQQRLLRKIYESPNITNYINVLDLFYELDTNTFQQSILTWFLKEFKEHTTSSYQTLNKLPIHIIKKRQSMTFNKNFIISYKRGKTPYSKKLEQNQKFFSPKVGVQKHVTRLMASGAICETIRMVEYCTRTLAIMKIISQRESHLLCEFEFTYSPKDRDNLINIIDEEKLYKLDDSPDNILNLPQNFEFFNFIIHDNSFSYLDVDNSSQFLQKLENQRWDSDLSEFLNIS